VQIETVSTWSFFLSFFLSFLLLNLLSQQSRSNSYLRVLQSAASHAKRSSGELGLSRSAEKKGRREGKTERKKERKKERKEGDSKIVKLDQRVLHLPGNEGLLFSATTDSTQDKNNTSIKQFR
jgi:hypothetical protein